MTARPEDLTAPRWPTTARSSMSWPRRSPAARPAAPARKARTRSSRSPPNLGAAGHPLEPTGDQPKDLRLSWNIDPGARAGLEEEIFGKHVLITDHDDWPVPRSSPGTGPSPRPSPGSADERPARGVLLPMHHWTEHNIRVHVFTCVLALQLAHLMRSAPAGRTETVRPRTPGPARRHRRNRAHLPLHRRPAQSTPHDHRAHR